MGRQFESLFTDVRNGFLSESFQFIVNGESIEIEIWKSTALFPAVREQFLVDSCARKFFVNDREIEAADIRSLELQLSGEKISNPRSEALLSNILGNVDLEWIFLNHLKSDIWTNPSELVMERRLDLDSADVSIFSMEVLNSLFCRELVSVESEDALLRFILGLGPSFWDLLMHIQIEFLSEDGSSLLNEHFGIPSESVWCRFVDRIAHSPCPFDSKIISGFPKIFAELGWKQFSLLWRGSRDGFKAQEFHLRCNSYRNTLTVILDTKGNIFGGFTPQKWESPVLNWRQKTEKDFLKTDHSLKSFLFTLKNPHDIPARRFPLKAEMKHQAINCCHEFGPCFGFGPPDIIVSDNCNTFKTNFASLGRTYTNNSGVNNDIIFTGSSSFQVRDIEVFEITE
jgi:hypothetical protein